MAEMKACRICLLTEGKFYDADVYQLRVYYEEITGRNVTMEDNLPQYFCCECATLLHKYHKFKDKCYRGQNILSEMFWREPVDYEILKTLDRKAKDLESSINLMSHTKQVNVCMVMSESLVKNETKSHSILEDYLTDYANDNDNSDHHTDEDADVKDILPIVMPVEFRSPSPSTYKVEARPLLETVKIERPLRSTKKKTQSKTKNTKTPKEPKVSKEVVVPKQSKKPKYRLKNRGKVVEFTKEEILSLRKPITRKHILDEKFWNIQVLSDEEAVKQYQLKSEAEYYMRAPHRCTDCFKGFSQEIMLERHQQLRHNPARGKAECRFCHYRFKWPGKLRAHMRQHYEMFQCLRCNYVTNNTGGAEMHDDMHNGVKKKCTHCGEVFRHLSTYYTHLRMAHRSQHICTLCGESFVSEVGLNQHRRVRHVNDTPSVVEGDEEAASTYCETCDITFETRVAFDTHRYHSDKHTEGLENLIEDPTTVAINDKLLNEVNRDVTNETAGDKSDEDTFLSDLKFKGRKVRRKRVIPTTCQHCGKQFSTQKACRFHHLKEHPRHSFYHPSERHICEICGLSMAPGSVQAHLNTHSKDRMFACDTCGRKFSTRVSLKRHQLVHTGQKPFACSACHKRFTQKGSMKLHYRTVHLKEPYPKRNRRKDSPQNWDCNELGGMPLFPPL